MGDAAASGGYYVSASAGHIVARRNTLTGSIGVISLRPVATKLYEKLSVNPVAVERGERSGLFDLSRQPTDDERRVLAGQVDAIYGEFKDRVAEGRNFEPESLEKLAGGRVWTGIEAHENGLIDELGGWQTAFDKARELAGIQIDAPEVALKIPPPKTGRPMPENAAEAAHALAEDYKEALGEYRSQKVWAHAPYTFSED